VARCLHRNASDLQLRDCEFASHLLWLSCSGSGQSTHTCRRMQKKCFLAGMQVSGWDEVIVGNWGCEGKGKGEMLKVAFLQAQMVRAWVLLVNGRNTVVHSSR